MVSWFASTVSDDDDPPNAVSILLNGQESTLEFMDIPDAEVSGDVIGDVTMMTSVAATISADATIKLWE